ncbi:plasmid mobilization relaxosome protein MobC [Commensalibacter sp. ESL0392]|nr:plasmid mobilization relaxosome protein MobC [Commensalibacter melissae]
MLYELNKIGVNLNQIAKKIQYSKNNIEWLIEIIHIEQQLTCLLENDH